MGISTEHSLKGTLTDNSLQGELSSTSKLSGQLTIGTVLNDNTGAVRYDVEMDLTDEEKAQARANIGADGVHFITDETLDLTDGVLSVNTADSAEADNTLPITAAAVHTQLGNIEILLKTI